MPGQVTLSGRYERRRWLKNRHWPVERDNATGPIRHQAPSLDLAPNNRVDSGRYVLRRLESRRTAEELQRADEELTVRRGIL